MVTNSEFTRTAIDVIKHASVLGAFLPSVSDLVLVQVGFRVRSEGSDCWSLLL